MNINIVFHFRCLEWEVANNTKAKIDEFGDKEDNLEQSHTKVENMVNFTEIVGDDVETVEVSNKDLNTTVPFKYCSKFIEDLEQPLELQLVKNLKF